MIVMHKCTSYKNILQNLEILTLPCENLKTSRICVCKTASSEHGFLFHKCKITVTMLNYSQIVKKI